MTDNGNNDIDFYRQFVEHTFLRLSARFARFDITHKYSLSRKSCRFACKSDNTGTHTLCRIVDLTDNERGKLEWFSQDQRHIWGDRPSKKFILIFYRDRFVRRQIETVEGTYKKDGELKTPYNFALHYAPLKQDTSKW